MDFEPVTRLLSLLYKLPTLLLLSLTHMLSSHAMYVLQADSACEAQTDPIVQHNSSFCSSQEVWKFISELGISKVS